MKNAKKFKIHNLFSGLSDDISKIEKKDWIIIGVFVLFYLIISFYRLGTLQSPKTYYSFTYEGESIGVTLPSGSQEVSKMRYYVGPETGKYVVLVSADGESYVEVSNFESKYVFSWEDLEINQNFKYLKLVAQTPGSYLGEVQLYDQYGNKLLAKTSDDQSMVVLDELETVPAKISYLNSSYFDEIYFARSAYEYAHGINAMEWTHPPLGKLLMMIPVLLFGMSTFSYRLMGTLAGMLMIPVIYILAKRIFKNRKWAILAGLLMTFDTFHFAHTRMGTVDSFLVLFIMLSALFMYQYISLDKNTRLKPKLKNLFLSGLFMGLSIAIKWTGLYAGLALAIIFFADLIYKYTDKRKKISEVIFMQLVLLFLFFAAIVPIIVYYITALVSTAKLASTFTIYYYIFALLIFMLVLILKLLKKNKNLWKLFVGCFVFFVVIPLIIYVLCYLLFPNVYGYDNGILGIIDQTKNMYNYHAGLLEGHDFSSKWYTWPLMIKPVWYYVGYYGGNIKSTIVGIGNPAIWWFGSISIIYALISAILKRKKETLFIIVFIACCFLPYVFIGRVMFMYHYFPTLPFMMLAIVAFMKWITDKFKSNSFYLFYVGLIVLLFFIFYPVVSGMLTTSDYIDSLKWLSSWIF